AGGGARKRQEGGTQHYLHLRARGRTTQTRKNKGKWSKAMISNSIEQELSMVVNDVWGCKNIWTGEVGGKKKWSGVVGVEAVGQGASRDPSVKMIPNEHIDKDMVSEEDE
ncbi:hypothetical protein ACJX0J_008578, partial [Zea mays]